MSKVILLLIYICKLHWNLNVNYDPLNFFDFRDVFFTNIPEKQKQYRTEQVLPPHSSNDLLWRLNQRESMPLFIRVVLSR